MMADGPDTTLDPEDWHDIRALGHRILDDMFDHLEHIRSRPVWQEMPQAAREPLREPMPRGPGNLADAYATLQQSVIPYTVGNPHPGFMGWVHGAGTPVGMIAEMIAGGLNANVGGRNQAPVEVEKQVSCWMARLFGFPDEAHGIFVTGTSIANFMGVVVAGGARRRPPGGGGAGGAAPAGWRRSRAGCAPMPRPKRTAASRRRWTWRVSAPMPCARSRSTPAAASTWPTCAPRSMPTGAPGCTPSCWWGPPAP
jgi:hypothetical protein